MKTFKKSGDGNRSMGLKGTPGALTKANKT